MRTVAGLVFCVIAVLGMRASATQGAIDAFDFADAAQEQRYTALIAELRCPKCLNTNLAGSDAPIASDLRREVHRLVTTGASDGDILDFLQMRYGDFVLYDPPLRVDTLLLWGLPLVLCVVAAAVAIGVARRSKGTGGDVLNNDEAERLDVLVGAGARPGQAPR